MMKLFGKLYAGILSIFAILILIAAPVLGFFAGKYHLLDEIMYPAGLSDNVIGIIFAAVAFVLTFILEALTFGHEAQIIEIRRKVEKIEKKDN